MPSFRVTWLLVALLLAPSSASAQTSDDAEARAEFEAGRDAFSANAYEEALAHFRRAYALSGRALLLFNIGSAAERLGRDDEAAEAYRAFVEALPGDRSAPEARRRLQLIEARAAEAAPDPSAPAREGGWLWSWVGLGATAASAGAIGLSWALANDAYAELEASCYARGCTEGELAASDVQARIDATTAMWIVTGALAAATVVLFVVEAPRDAPTESVSVSVGPGSIALEGRFR